jgi:PIN domain nuclease of toxin-antitoxin system
MILLDTHAVIWLAQVPGTLSDKATDAIHDARATDGLAVADKVLWEIAMLVRREQIRVKTSLRDFLREVEKHFQVLPITSAIAERSVQFSDSFPKDPTDRIIAATALVHGLKLITADRSIRASGEVPCIW